MFGFVVKALLSSFPTNLKYKDTIMVLQFDSTGFQPVAAGHINFQPVPSQPIHSWRPLLKNTPLPTTDELSQQQSDKLSTNTKSMTWSSESQHQEHFRRPVSHVSVLQGISKLFKSARHSMHAWIGCTTWNTNLSSLNMYVNFLYNTSSITTDNYMKSIFLIYAKLTLNLKSR